MIAVSQLSGEVIASDMIEIESYDPSLNGMKYDGSSFIQVAAQIAEPSMADKIDILWLKSEGVIV